jgi:hypothetical protein
MPKVDDPAFGSNFGKFATDARNDPNLLEFGGFKSSSFDKVFFLFLWVDPPPPPSPFVAAGAKADLFLLDPPPLPPFVAGAGAFLFVAFAFRAEDMTTRIFLDSDYC